MQKNVVKKSQAKTAWDNNFNLGLTERGPSDVDICGLKWLKTHKIDGLF
jgi:hypothetical protein